MTETPLHAVVTGASSGIGAATVRDLIGLGWRVTAVARRADRLEALAAETGCAVAVADITSDADVEALAAGLEGPVHALVNNAGGAIGWENVAVSDLDAWTQQYALNVVGTVRVTKALLPLLEASGRGDIVNLTSTAGHEPYENGAGYVAAKHAEAAMTRTLRLELTGSGVRVIEIAPGMVKTEEFSKKRFDGDEDKAAAVYEGVEPLTAADVADAISYALTRPHHMNVDLMVLRPREQGGATKLVRR
ncbi:SDR family oxidoreductase [Demequina flava]|uniref:SDR family oxidoreductase n=1 Tax=Demequina flava TaxID=1095025 RepID=UPI000783D14D|nr:SDR family oxidoreductase [Demequina flava]